MFIRNGEPRRRRSNAFEFTIAGVVLIAIGGLLLGLGALGVPLSGRPGFAAIVLPAAGIACLIIALVDYIRAPNEAREGEDNRDKSGHHSL